MFVNLKDVHMPVMNGLEATSVIRAFEETGNWDAAVQAGIEYNGATSDSSTNGEQLKLPRKRLPIVAVSIAFIQ